MPNPDDWMTFKKVSEEIGGPFSEDFFRDATYRAKGFHPLPYVPCGKSGKHRRVRWETVQKWLREEEERSVSA